MKAAGVRPLEAVEEAVRGVARSSAMPLSTSTGLLIALAIAAIAIPADQA